MGQEIKMWIQQHLEIPNAYEEVFVQNLERQYDDRQPHRYYAPISSSGVTSGLHRTILKALDAEFSDAVLDVSDLNSGEINVLFVSDRVNDLLGFLQTIQKAIKAEYKTWDGQIRLVNTVKNYSNPLGVQAWTAEVLLITRTPCK